MTSVLGFVAASATICHRVTPRPRHSDCSQWQARFHLGLWTALRTAPVSRLVLAPAATLVMLMLVLVLVLMLVAMLVAMLVHPHHACTHHPHTHTPPPSPRALPLYRTRDGRCTPAASSSAT